MTKRPTPEFQRNRRIILEGDPLCHWCKKAPATEADHLIESDREGGDDLDNLVPACRTCNSRRGATYVNRKTAARLQARRNINTEMTEPFLVRETVRPRVLSLPYPAEPKPVQTSSAAFELAAMESGEIAPRLVSPVLGNESFGPEVAQWTRDHLGRELFPWQLLALDGQLAHDGEGNLLHRESLVSTARQNGKSTAFHGLIGWALTQWPVHRGEPVHVLSTAHKLDRATAVFTDLAPILEAKFGAEVTWSYGRSQLRMPDGSTWVVKAATPQNAHGGTYTLVVCDEIWSIDEAVIFDALRPAMIAVKNPLLSMWSTAGDEGSRAFMRLREQAINAIDQRRPTRLFFAEWSAEPGTAWDDRTQWHRANPAMGHTLTFDALEAAAETPDRAAFIRAHLNQWIASNKSWLLPGEWEACRTEMETPVPEILSVDSSLDEALYVGVYSSRLPTGELLVWTAFVVDSEQKAWEQIANLMASQPQLKLAITPALDLHTPLPLQRRRTVVGYKELCTWVPLIRRSIAEGQLLHTGDQLLSEHVNRAVGVKVQSGGLTLSSQKSPGPIELARCMVFASALASKPANSGKAAFAIGR